MFFDTRFCASKSILTVPVCKEPNMTQPKIIDTSAISCSVDSNVIRGEITEPAVVAPITVAVAASSVTLGVAFTPGITITPGLAIVLSLIFVVMGLLVCMCAAAHTPRILRRRLMYVHEDGKREGVATVGFSPKDTIQDVLKNVIVDTMTYEYSTDTPLDNGRFISTLKLTKYAGVKLRNANAIYMRKIDTPIGAPIAKPVRKLPASIWVYGNTNDPVTKVQIGNDNSTVSYIVNSYNNMIGRRKQYQRDTYMVTYGADSKIPLSHDTLLTEIVKCGPDVPVAEAPLVIRKITIDDVQADLRLYHTSETDAEHDPTMSASQSSEQ